MQSNFISMFLDLLDPTFCWVLILLMRLRPVVANSEMPENVLNFVGYFGLSIVTELAMWCSIELDEVRQHLGHLSLSRHRIAC